MGGSISILRNSLASCVNPLNFATGDLIDSCYTSNSSISCLQDERYRAAEFVAAAPLKDGIPQTSQIAVGFPYSVNVRFWPILLKNSSNRTAP